MTENTTKTKRNGEPIKGILRSVRLPFDCAYQIEQEAIKRDISFSAVVRERLASYIPQHPLPLSDAKKNELVSSEQTSTPIADEQEEVAGPPQTLSRKLSSRQSPANPLPNGRCAHGFSVWKGETACPDCKRA